MTAMQQLEYLKLKMIPTKGKGHLVTARNLAMDGEIELSRPLTTDPRDNALFYGEIEDSAGDEQGVH